MIKFSPLKINIGLQVKYLRPDGYHNIESVFYPLPFYDILEINKSKTFKFTTSGLMISGKIEDNLIIKAYLILKKQYNIPNVHIHLHKQIPMGAGLGGGSSNASTTLLMLNSLFNLKITRNKLVKYALELGSDCPFFIYEKPMYITGRGEKLEPIFVSLKGYFLYLINPNIHISTKQAYSNLVYKEKHDYLHILLNNPIKDWKKNIKNDFEESVFNDYPKIKQIKQKLYNNGAIYASMTGSGSTLYGVFKEKPKLFEEYDFEKIVEVNK